jgi:hypothetical protein
VKPTFTVAEATGLLRRISGDATQWIPLRDAFLYAWMTLHNSKTAIYALLENLEKSEIHSRAAIWEIFDLADEEADELIQTTKWVDIPHKFWDGAAVDWSGKDLAKNVSKVVPVLHKVQGITVRREDIFRLWPPPAELPAKTVTAQLAPSHAPPQRPVSIKDLETFLMATLDGQMTEEEADAAAKAKFPDRRIPRNIWRQALATVPADKKRRKGEKRLKS